MQKLTSWESFLCNTIIRWWISCDSRGVRHGKKVSTYHVYHKYLTIFLFPRRYLYVSHGLHRLHGEHELTLCVPSGMFSYHILLHSAGNLVTRILCVIREIRVRQIISSVSQVSHRSFIFHADCTDYTESTSLRRAYYPECFLHTFHLHGAGNLWPADSAISAFSACLISSACKSHPHGAGNLVTRILCVIREIRVRQKTILFCENHSKDSKDSREPSLNFKL